MPDLATVYVVFADEAEAERVATTLVKERLAACANLLGSCRSIYRWEGEVRRADEAPALFKSTAEAVPRLLARLTELHSYDTPAAVAWPVGFALPPVLSWVRENVR